MIAPDLRRDEGRWDAKGKEVWEPHSKIHLSVKYGVFYEKKKKSRLLYYLALSPVHLRITLFLFPACLPLAPASEFWVQKKNKAWFCGWGLAPYEQLFLPEYQKIPSLDHYSAWMGRHHTTAADRVVVCGFS